MPERVNNKQFAILGGSGLVGSEMCHIFEEKGYGINSPRSVEVDGTSEEQMFDWMKNVTSNAVVISMAWTEVDGAEMDSNQEKLRMLNIEAVRNAALAAKRLGKHLIFISSDFVFPGNEDDPGPYGEEHPINQDTDDIGKYGKSKIEAEKILKEILREHTIIRIANPFGNKASNKDFVNKIKNYDSLANDIQITPTYIPELAEVVEQVIENKIFGVLHVACQPPTTPYEIGKYVCHRLKIAEPKPISHKDLPKGRAPRPTRGGLKTKHSEQIAGRNSLNWREAVDRHLE